MRSGTLTSTFTVLERDEVLVLELDPLQAPPVLPRSRNGDRPSHETALGAPGDVDDLARDQSLGAEFVRDGRHRARKTTAGHAPP